MGKALGSNHLMVALFICNPPLLHGRSYVKVGKYADIAPQTSKMAVTARGSDLWVLSTPEGARADAKSATSSSKSATHGRPHDSSDTLGASSSPALALMQLLGPRFPAAPPKAPTRGAPHPTFTFRCGGRRIVRRDSQTCSVTRCEALFCSDLRRESIVRACFLFFCRC